jgi:hypothetical protein
VHQGRVCALRPHAGHLEVPVTVDNQSLNYIINNQQSKIKLT